MEDGVHFTFGLHLMFWFHVFWFSDSRQRNTTSCFNVKSPVFPFCSTIPVSITRMFGMFDPNNSKLQGHQLRLKHEMLLKDMHNGECIPNVFCGSACPCVICTCDASQHHRKKALSLFGYWNKTGRFSAQRKRVHWLSSRIFSKAERLCNCQQHRAKNIINFWIHPGTG